MNPEVLADMKAHPREDTFVIRDGELVFTGAQPWDSESLTKDLPRLREIDGIDCDTAEYVDADGNILARVDYDSATVEYFDADGNILTRVDFGSDAREDLKDLNYDTIARVDYDSATVEYVDADGNTVEYADTDGNTIAHVYDDLVEYVDADGNVVAYKRSDSAIVEYVDDYGNTVACVGDDIVEYEDLGGAVTYLNVDGVVYVEAEDSTPAAEVVAAADDDEFDYDLGGMEGWLGGHRKILDDGRHFVPLGFETPNYFWDILAFWSFGSRYPYKASDCVFDDREGARRVLQEFLEANRAWLDLDDCDLEKTLDLAFMKEADGRYYLRAPSWSDLDLQEHPATRDIYRGRR